MPRDLDRGGFVSLEEFTGYKKQQCIMHKYVEPQTGL